MYVVDYLTLPGKQNVDNIKMWYWFSQKEIFVY